MLLPSVPPPVGFTSVLLLTAPCVPAGVEDRGLVYQAEGATTSLMDAIRNVFLRPADGETKARLGCASAVGCLSPGGAPATPSVAACSLPRNTSCSTLLLDSPHSQRLPAAHPAAGGAPTGGL